MKKTAGIFCVLLTVCAVLGTVFAPSFTGEEPSGAAKLLLTVESVHGRQGEEVTLDIVLDSGEQKLNGWQFSLSYDQKVLKYKSCTPCPENRELPVLGFVSEEEERYGYPLTVGHTFNIAADQNASVQGETVLERVTFEVLGDAAPGTSPVTVEECAVGNSFYYMRSPTESIHYPCTYQAGGVTVDPDVTVTALASEGRVNAGSSLTVTYTLQNPSALPVAGYEFRLSYPEECFSLEELILPDALDGKPAAGHEDLEQALAGATLSGDGAFTGRDALLLTAVFSVKEDAEEGTCVFSADLTREGSGVFGPLPEGEFYMVLAVPCSVSVGAEADETLPGDLNGDGKVTPADRTILARYCAGWDAYLKNPPTLKIADLNGDGAVTPADRTILARHCAGWKGYTQLPITVSPSIK